MAEEALNFEKFRQYQRRDQILRLHNILDKFVHREDESLPVEQFVRVIWERYQADETARRALPKEVA